MRIINRKGFQNEPDCGISDKPQGNREDVLDEDVQVFSRIPTSESPMGGHSLYHSTKITFVLGCSTEIKSRPNEAG